MRRDYDILRTEQAKALEQEKGQEDRVLPSKAAAEPAPERPQGHPSQSKTPSWPMDQRRETQESAALKWNKAANQQKQELQEGRKASAEQPTQSQSSQPGQGRSLRFSEDREASAPDRTSLKREQAEGAAPQKQGEGKSLSFPEDRNPEQDRGR